MKPIWFLSRRSLLRVFGASLAAPALDLLSRFGSTETGLDSPQPADGVNQPNRILASDARLQNQPLTAIVLSGGGARGDFQVGALRYLYDQGIRPDIVCGTSVGAINGIKIAEGEGDLEEGLSGLEQIWLKNMKFNENMYLPQDWFRALETNPAGNALLNQISESGTSSNFGSIHPIAWVFLVPALVNIGVILQTVKDLEDILKDGLKSKSIFTLTPIEELLSDSTYMNRDKVLNSGIKLRLAMTALESGDIHYVNERSQLVRPYGHFYTTSEEERNRLISEQSYIYEGILGYVYLTPTANSGIPSPLEPPPGIDDWATEVFSTDTGEVLGPQVRFPWFRLYNPEAKLWVFARSIIERDWFMQEGYLPEGSDGVVYYTAQGAPCYRLVHPENGWLYTTNLNERNQALEHRYVDDELLGNISITPQPDTVPLYKLRSTHLDDVDMVKAVIASASIPGIFPPVKLNQENYVDGGVRELLPVKSALDLGATTIYAIEASPEAIHQSSYDNAGLLSISHRAVFDLMIDEIRKNDVEQDKNYVPINLIQPIVDVHDTLTIDPGLIRISISYGYMRAADILRGEGAAVRARADEITILRKEIWKMEFAANNRRNNGQQIIRRPSAHTLIAVREAKRQLKALVDDRRSRGGVIPADANTWWEQWEAHNWPYYYVRTPWESLVYRGWELLPGEPSP